MDERTRPPDRANNGIRAIGDRKEAGRRAIPRDGSFRQPGSARPFDVPKAAPAVSMPDIEAMLAETISVAPPKPVQSARPEPKVDFQSEIRARVANFRAHQERFNREREAYCSATMAKVHAALREDTAPPPLGK